MSLWQPCAYRPAPAVVSRGQLCIQATVPVASPGGGSSSRTMHRQHAVVMLCLFLLDASESPVCGRATCGKCPPLAPQNGKEEAKDDKKEDAETPVPEPAMPAQPQLQVGHLPVLPSACCGPTGACCATAPVPLRILLRRALPVELRVRFACTQNASPQVWRCLAWHQETIPFGPCLLPHIRPAPALVPPPHIGSSTQHTFLPPRSPPPPKEKKTKKTSPTPPARCSWWACTRRSSS